MKLVLTAKAQSKTRTPRPRITLNFRHCERSETIQSRSERSEAIQSRSERSEAFPIFAQQAGTGDCFVASLLAMTRPASLLAMTRPASFLAMTRSVSLLAMTQSPGVLGALAVKNV